MSGSTTNEETAISTRDLVDDLERRFAALETRFSLAYWDSQIDAGPETDRRRAETELAVRRAKGDPEAYRAVLDALRSNGHDPLLRRQLEVLRLSLAANQMDEAERAGIVGLAAAIESDFASYRPELGGRRVSDNDIEDILRRSDDDALRRRAWEASKEVGAVVAERVRELARLRNRAARRLGYRDHYVMALELQEMSEPWLFALLDEVDRLTAGPFATFKRRLDDALRSRFGVTEVAPWHYADPFFQTLPPDLHVDLDPQLRHLDATELALRTFAGWGIDISGVLERSDLYPRERKCQHAFCIDIDRSGDVRVLANVVPGERWIETMLHECGHAAYDLCVDPDLPYLLRRSAHTFVTESIAILCGRLVNDAVWLVDVARLDAGEVEALRGRLDAATAATSLLFARWVLVMAHFERALYADPDADLDGLWWELVQRFQSVGMPGGRRGPDWAAKIHIAVSPVYYHNYLLGEMLATQLEDVCHRDAGGLVERREAGDLLRERIFRHGAALRWDELIPQATGEQLSARRFVDRIAARL